jgi:excinuclease ABC subunit A
MCRCGQLVVISGLSGSGKSSLAFETLFAEGQRRYIETFSPYARQFLDRMDKPQARRIEGIPPAIAIEQRNSVKSTRSTVGTMTEITDYTKVFWAQLARLHCRGCGRPVSQEPPQSIWPALRALAAEAEALGHVHAGFERQVFAGGIAGAGGTAGLPAAAAGRGGARRWTSRWRG